MDRQEFEERLRGEQRDFSGVDFSGVDWSNIYINWELQYLRH